MANPAAPQPDPADPAQPAEPKTPLGPVQRGPDLHVDPYLRWAEARRFRSFMAGKPTPGERSAAARRALTCVVELDVALLRQAEAERGLRWWKLLARDAGAFVTPAFHTIPDQADGQPPTRSYATVVVPTSQVLALRGAGGFVRRVVLSVPRGDGDDCFEVENVRVRAARGPVVRRKAGAPARAGQPMRPVVAVIDDGFPFLHPQFNDARGRSRLRWLWDQDAGVRLPPGEDRSGPWREPAGFEYGRELSAAGLKAFIAESARAGQPLDATSLYARLLYPARPAPGHRARADAPAGALAVPRTSHGARSSALAAGRAWPTPAGDAAERADLIFVQLPSEAMADTSGGGLANYVIDALRYILQRSDPRVPLVVNLSFGAAAGPHDGSSVLECALEQMLAERRDFAIVVPSGNLHFAPGDGQPPERRLHAALRLQPKESAELRWQVPAGGARDHFLELWPRGAGAPPLLAVTLTPPRGVTLGLVAPGKPRFALLDKQGRPTHGVLNCVRSPLGLGADDEGAPMVLLVVAGPPRRPDAADAPDLVAPVQPWGTWHVGLQNNGNAAIELDAWIERADATFGGDSRQSFFALDEEDATARCTLTTVANGAGPLVVGGLVGPADAAQPAVYSSAGPSLGARARNGPDFSEFCETSPLKPWLDVPAFLPGAWEQANGTSIAAPQAARKVVNLMCGAGYPAGGLGSEALKHWLLGLAVGPADARRGPVLPA